MTYDNKVGKQEQDQRTYENTPEARRVMTVNESGDYVSGGGGTQYTEGDVDTTITGTAIMHEDTGDTLRPVSTAYPLPTTVNGSVGGVIIANSLDFTAFDLNAAAFSEVTNIAVDYILDSIELNFSTTESKTITVTSEDGTIIYEDTNINQSISLTDLNLGYDANNNITVAVTQFGSAGTMDCILKTRNAAASLIGTPDLNGDTTISTLNSTTSLLTASSTFTGTWEDVTQYDSVVVAAKTDQNGTFTVEFSPDGVNQDSTLTRYYRTNQIEAPHRFTITRQYCRVTFTNTSASDQTYLRLQTMFGTKGDLNAPTDSTLAQDFDAIVTRPTNYHYEVALDRRQGHATWNKWGYNADIDIGTETIWSVGGTLSRMTSADTFDVVSTSTDDDGSPGGTGARTIRIWGVDENFEAQTEDVTMNGTTTVTTTNNWLGINRISVLTAGSGRVNAGDINITVTTGGATQGQIPTGEGTSQQAFFFVQAGHTALMDWMLLNILKTSGGQSPIVTLKGFVTSNVSGARYEVFRHKMDTALDNSIELNPSQPFIVGEQSLFELEATTDKDNTEVSARFSLIEIRSVDT